MKCKLKVLLTAIFSLSLASLVSASEPIFSTQFVNQDEWDANDGRRYTTFNTSASLFDGSLLDANGDPVGPIEDFIGPQVGTTNNNPDTGTQNSPGPGFAYIPTGVEWEPNTVYSIDFIVLRRADMPQNTDVQYGLWAGLPSDDTGPGNYFVPSPNVTYEARELPSLGTEGLVKISSGFLDAGDGVFVSDLSGFSEVDQEFTFTTGPDVSGLGEMVLFVRTATDRIHWDSLSVSAAPVPSPSALLPLDADFGTVRFLEIMSDSTRAEAIDLGDTVYQVSNSVPDMSGNERTGFVRGGDLVFSSNVPAMLTGSSTSLDMAAEDIAVVAEGYQGISGSNPRTVAAWVYPGNDLNPLATLVEWGVNNAGRRWTVRLDDSRLRVEVQNGFAVADAALEADAWNHIAVTFEGNNVEDVIFYLNGVQQSIVNSNSQGVDTAAGVDVGIGFAPAVGGRFFDGLIDGLGIWSRALSAEDVTDLASGAPVSSIEEGLELSYDFESPPSSAITSLPPELSGNLGFRTENEFFGDAGPGAIDVVVDRDTKVFIALDQAASVPDWIAGRYTQTGQEVVTDLAIFDLWERQLAARERIVLPAMELAQGENNYWVIFDKGPDAVVSSPDGMFLGTAEGDTIWRLGEFNWTLTSDAGSQPHQASLLTTITNFDPERGFKTAATLRVPRLQNAGDNAIGFSLLGDEETGESIRAEWAPREAGGESSLRLVDSSTGTILAEEIWTGLVPSKIDNDVGVSAGASESQFSVGELIFTGGQAVPLAEDFESGMGDWTVGGDPDQWEIGVPTTGPGSAFSGENVAATRLNQNYESAGISNTVTVSWLRSPAIDLSGVMEVSLSFQEFMALDPALDGDGNPFHFGTVSVLDADSMEPLGELATYNEQISEWTERTFDLTEFAGQHIILEFGLSTDQFDDAADGGWYLDDITVTGSVVTIESMPEALALNGTLNGIATDEAAVDDESDSFLEFTVTDRGTDGNQGVTVYVAWDVRGSGLEPDWLRDNFVLTDHFVGVSGNAGEHRLWAREYADGESVTLGGASAQGAGPFPAGMNNYFVLFGDARPGLEQLYTLKTEGQLNEGVWTIDFTLSDGQGNEETVSGATIDSRDGATEFGLFARHPDAADGTLTHTPIWEVFEFSMDFFDELGELLGFEAWRELYFPDDLDNPEISGANASPAGDGVKNLVKYALDRNPFERLTMNDIATTGFDGEGNLVLFYWERTDIDDIEYVPEISENLVDWESGEPHVIKEIPGDEEGNLRAVDAIGILPEEADRGFMRLKIRQKE